MLEEQKVVTTLADKVSELIKRYQEVCEQNEELRNELVTVKAQNEALNSQLTKLEEDMIMKNLSEDDLMQQIQNVLGEE